MKRRGTLQAGASASLACAAALALATPTPAAALEAKLPAPGSYRLQRIQKTPETELVDAAGRPERLSQVAKGAVTALAFFYSRCQDPAGCPVAWSTFEAVRKEAGEDPLLRRRLRLVFVSLDPERDSASVLKLLEESESGGSSVPWKFLTARSQTELLPLLRVMGQDVAPDIDAKGAKTQALNHMLKAFLIDPDGWTREIYTLGFLTPENLLNDARTLALEFPTADNGAKPP